MSALTTHVLDTGRGAPARGLGVQLDIWRDGGWSKVGGGTTNDDGRVPDLLPGETLEPGTYRITFATGPWFDTEGIEGFYPEASVVFAIRTLTEHCHVPLLISPYAYSTYRGS